MYAGGFPGNLVTMWQGSLTINKGLVKEELITLSTIGNQLFGSIEGILEYFIQEVTKKIAEDVGVKLQGSGHLKRERECTLAAR